MYFFYCEGKSHGGGIRVRTIRGFASQQAAAYYVFTKWQHDLQKWANTNGPAHAYSYTPTVDKDGPIDKWYQGNYRITGHRVYKMEDGQSPKKCKPAEIVGIIKAMPEYPAVAASYGLKP